MLSFVEEKWGDIVAIMLLAVGVVLVVFSPVAKETGSGLIMAALGLLKLTKTYKLNNNGAPSGVPK